METAQVGPKTYKFLVGALGSIITRAALEASIDDADENARRNLTINGERGSRTGGSDITSR